MGLRDLASNHVRLIDPLFVVAPFRVPDVLVLEGLDDDGLPLPVVPQLAVSLHDRLDPVDHPDDSNRWTYPRQLSTVVVSTEQLERAVARLHRLPVNVVELYVVDGGILQIGTAVIPLSLRLTAGILAVLVPVGQRQAGYPLFDLLDQLLLRFRRPLVQQRFQLQRILRRVVGHGGQSGEKAGAAGIRETGGIRGGSLQQVSGEAEAGGAAVLHQLASTVNVVVEEELVGRLLGRRCLPQAVLHVMELHRHDHQQAPSEHQQQSASGAPGPTAAQVLQLHADRLAAYRSGLAASLAPAPLTKRIPDASAPGIPSKLQIS